MSTLIAGFDGESPVLFQTDPSGTSSEWRANSIGNNSKTIREFLEKNYKEDLVLSEKDASKLTIKALLEVVEATKNMEIAIVRKSGVTFMKDEEVEAFVEEIEKEKKEAEENK